MPALFAGIHVLFRCLCEKKDVDARHKAGHDRMEFGMPFYGTRVAWLAAICQRSLTFT